MTPYEKAQQILDSVIAAGEDQIGLGTWPGWGLPTVRYAQMNAAPVISCEVLTVSVMDVAPHTAYGPVECNASQLSTFSIILARNCMNTSDDDGVDVPEAVESASVVADQDAQLLWGWADSYSAFLSKDWSISWTLNGGIGITTLTLTTGID